MAMSMVKDRTVRYFSRTFATLNFKQLVWASLFALFTGAMVVGAGMFLDTHYPNPVRPEDLVLDHIPEVRLFIYLGEAIGISQAIITVLILARRHFEDGPTLLFQVFVMFLLRAFAITLTPLAQIQPPTQSFGDAYVVARYTYKGMFFSGHTGSAFTQFMFFKKRPGSRAVYALQFTLSCMQGVCLLAGHSHYSIDVFGALFVAYFVTHFDFKQLVPARWREASWAPWAAANASREKVVTHQPEREMQAA